MDIVSYVLLLAVIFAGFLIGIILSKLCFEESDELTKFLKFLKGFIMLIITIIISFEAYELQYYILLFLVLISGILIAYYSLKGHYNNKRLKIITKIFLGMIFFLSSLSKNNYFIISVTASLFIYEMLHATIYSWEFCRRKGIFLLKGFNKKILKNILYRVGKDYLIIFFTASIMFMLFNYLIQAGV